VHLFGFHYKKKKRNVMKKYVYKICIFYVNFLYSSDVQPYIIETFVLPQNLDSMPWMYG
jgi:hypothetical protein